MLPTPDDDALAHSARLTELIGAEIRAHAAIPFSRFMELALYAPGLGYYSAGATKFGAGGDFITAPELGPLFAECAASAMASVLGQVGGRADVVELGGGSGVFARDALLRLDQLGVVPHRYRILEPSADLRQRQRRLLQQALPASLSGRVEWIDGPPAEPWDGVVFANEVLDALPTPRFSIRDGGVMEEHVGLGDDGCLHVLDRPADAMLTASVRHVERYLGTDFGEGYRSELLPQLPYWIQAVGGLIRQGAMLFVDYGYPRAEYYLPERRDGTLVCHYRHRAHADPFHLPGLQDLTAFVDFTALVEAGTQAGFDLSGYCSQSSFLLGNGLIERLESRAGCDEVQRHAHALEAKRLTLPGEMGERFQVMGFERGVEFGPAFPVGDLSRRL